MKIKAYMFLQFIKPYKTYKLKYQRIKIIKTYMSYMV